MPHTEPNQNYDAVTHQHGRLSTEERINALRGLGGAFPEMEIPARCQDRLDTLFDMQAKLNDFAFKNNGLVDHKGQTLTMSEIHEEAKQATAATGSCSVNSLVCEWVRRYTQALGAEVKEVEELAPVKFWSKSGLDLNKLQVEIIDALHFWISLALVAGLDSDAVMAVYSKKYEVNVQRQQNNYTARGDQSL